MIHIIGVPYRYGDASWITQIEWCECTFKGREWYFDKREHTFVFLNEVDATLFRLKWAESIQTRVKEDEIIRRGLF